MTICVDSYVSTSRREIDTLKADAPFAVARSARDRYLITVDGRTFEVSVADGGHNAVLDFNSPHPSQYDGITIDDRDPNWPQSITCLTGRAGSFHLEMMEDNFYCMITPAQNFDFRIVSGPERSYIAVREVSEGVEHLAGPSEPREVRDAGRRRTSRR